MRERATKEESECVRKKTQHTELYKLDESHWPRISIRTHVLFSSNTNMLFGSEIATHREIRGFPPTAERLTMVIYLEISQHYWIYIAMHTLRAQRTFPPRDCGESSSLLLSTSRFPPSDRRLIAIVRAKLIKYEFSYLGMFTVHREWISLWTGAEHFSEWVRMKVGTGGKWDRISFIRSSFNENIRFQIFLVR